MAFIVLRRSRNTKSYYLVESYRDQEGKTRKRTLCYLGREQDGTDTLEKALAHWQAFREQTTRELRKVSGYRRKLMQRRREAASQRIAILREQIAIAARLEAARIERQRWQEEAAHWQAIERLRYHPTEENARSAKQAYLRLAKRYHPDQGGSHQDFLRLKEAYDRAVASKRRHNAA